jgi:hypothetical protein
MKGHPNAGLGRRRRLIHARIDKIAGDAADRVLVLSYATVHQRVQGPRRDPNLGAVIALLRRAGPDPIVIGIGLDYRNDLDWDAIASDSKLLPQSLALGYWKNESEPGAGSELAVIEALAEADLPALAIDGVDIGPALAARVQEAASDWVLKAVPLEWRVGRLLAALKPKAVLMTHEGIRSAWLVAARRAGVRTFAVQHGMLYPTHPGYCHRRDPTVTLPDRTFVFGDYERAVLLEHGGYLPDEVAVSGSPRIDLARPSTSRVERVLQRSVGRVLGKRTGDDRRAVRAALGVSSQDRMLVISTAYGTLLRRFHLAHMIERVLGGPLPGVHLVFKLHPGESDDGPYRDLVEGLARAGAYRPPPITIIKEIDLYGLLAAADAHLGFHSTVLTDAVVVGVPNLIAIVQAYSDPLGYVSAGVAVPVSDVDEVRSAIHSPPHMDPAARESFLRLHFREGDASRRIVADIRRSIQG